jgi:hypothetical protein
MYLGTSPLPLPPVPPQTGFWAVLHEIRSEYAQIVVALYLLINGPGKWSIDALLDKLGTPGPCQSWPPAVGKGKLEQAPFIFPGKPLSAKMRGSAPETTHDYAIGRAVFPYCLASHLMPTKEGAVARHK